MAAMVTQAVGLLHAEIDDGLLAEAAGARPVAVLSNIEDLAILF